MVPYWIVPLNAPPPPAGLNPERPFCVEVPLGKNPIEVALAVSRATEFEVYRLPYPATPNLSPTPSGCPSFCYCPNSCKGRTSCPRSYACSE